MRISMHCRKLQLGIYDTELYDGLMAKRVFELELLQDCVYIA